jgi:hypothetical protein
VAVPEFCVIVVVSAASPLTRIHSQLFAVTFEPNEPVAIVVAAAAASLNFDWTMEPAISGS